MFSAHSCLIEPINSEPCKTYVPSCYPTRTGKLILSANYCLVPSHDDLVSLTRESRKPEISSWTDSLEQGTKPVVLTSFSEPVAHLRTPVLRAQTVDSPKIELNGKPYLPITNRHIQKPKLKWPVKNYLCQSKPAALGSGNHLLKCTETSERN